MRHWQLFGIAVVIWAVAIPATMWATQANGIGMTNPTTTTLPVVGTFNF